MLAYDSTALLVEIGSCLGLWLGFSVVGKDNTVSSLVVGIFDIIVLAALTSKKLSKKLFKYDKH